MKGLFYLLFLLIPYLSFAQSIETFAGTGAVGHKNGPVDIATFGSVEQMALDSEGNIYICDRDNHVIRKIDLLGEVSTFAGTGVQGDVLGNRLEAQLNLPTGIAIDDNNNIYICDAGNQKIKVIKAFEEVHFVAGTGEEAFADGPLEMASFDFPGYLCVDSEQNVFVADNNNNRIRKIDLELGVVTTFAGNNFQGHQDGIGQEAVFFLPQGIAIDKDDNLYIGDRNNNAIRKITPERVVTTYAGTTAEGHKDGPAGSAQFSGPKGLTVDSIGNVYVADRLNFVVRKIDTSGMVSTIAGLPGSSGYLDGPISDGTLIGRAVDVVCYGDDLLISDWINNVIRLYKPTSPTGIFSSNYISNPSIRLFPNPASEIVFVEGEFKGSFEITVVNLNNEILVKQENDSSLNVTSFPNGIYFVVVKGNGFSTTKKLIIK